MFEKIKHILFGKPRRSYSIPSGTVIVDWNKEALDKGLRGDKAKKMIINGRQFDYSSGYVQAYSENNKVPVFDKTEGRAEPENIDFNKISSNRLEVKD